MNRNLSISAPTALVLAASLLASTAASADAVCDWNTQAGDIVVGARMGPPPANRALAIMHTAIYDAVNAITKRYPSDASKLQAAPGASVDAAIAAASRASLAKLVPSQQAAIEAAYQRALAKVGDGAAKASGIALGEQAAAAVLAMRADDGAAAGESYRPHAAAGVYVPTVIPAVTHWPQRKPWLMGNAAQFRPAPPLHSRAPCGRATTTKPRHLAERAVRGGRPSKPRSPASGKPPCRRSTTASCSRSPMLPAAR